MFISSENAQSIVTEMKVMLGYNINIMDDTGTIIASTNPKRIGELHGGAQEVISKGLDELVVESDDQFLNCVPGINFPIRIDGSIVGVIGVTGAVKDVMTPGNVITRMTELMVESLMQKENQQMLEAARGQFVESWIFQQGDIGGEFIFRGKQLGIDVNIPRHVIMLDPSDESGSNFASLDEMKTNILLKQLSEMVGKNSDSFCFIINRRIVILLAGKKKFDLIESVNRIHAITASFCNQKIYIGVSSSTGCADTMGLAYREAKSACEIARISQKKQIIYYNASSPELIAESIPKSLKTAVTESAMAGCTEDEKAQFLSALNAFFQHNGNLNEAADSLFIHRNTLQYRLTKLEEKTGLDFRNPRDSFILFLISIWLGGDS